ncbi:MAG: hypothetical protein PHU03_06360 [Syntrophales bacterium]|nr:hypothetical protein [Syntrophales bacterium]
MKASTKGALLSAFVFPGVGQVSLRFYFRGAVLILVTLAALVFVVVTATRTALTALYSIQAQGGAVDLDRMSLEASKAVADLSSPAVKAALLVIIFCWLIAVIDAWLLGKRKERESTESLPI